MRHLFIATAMSVLGISCNEPNNPQPHARVSSHPDPRYPAGKPQPVPPESDGQDATPSPSSIPDIAQATEIVRQTVDSVYYTLAEGHQILLVPRYGRLIPAQASETLISMLSRSINGGSHYSLSMRGSPTVDPAIVETARAAIAPYGFSIKPTNILSAVTTFVPIIDPTERIECHDSTESVATCSITSNMGARTISPLVQSGEMPLRQIQGSWSLNSLARSDWNTLFAGLVTAGAKFETKFRVITQMIAGTESSAIAVEVKLQWTGILQKLDALIRSAPAGAVSESELARALANSTLLQTASGDDMTADQFRQILRGALAPVLQEVRFAQEPEVAYFTWHTDAARYANNRKPATIVWKSGSGANITYVMVTKAPCAFHPSEVQNAHTCQIPHQ